MKINRKAKKKEQKNKARIKSCGLHSFDCYNAIRREKAKQEKAGISVPIPPITIRCRCKNCGGTMSLMYAGPYMEALSHVKKQEEKNSGENKGICTEPKTI